MAPATRSPFARRRRAPTGVGTRIFEDEPDDEPPPCAAGASIPARPIYTIAKALPLPERRSVVIKARSRKSRRRRWSILSSTGARFFSREHGGWGRSSANATGHALSLRVHRHDLAGNELGPFDHPEHDRPAAADYIRDSPERLAFEVQPHPRVCWRGLIDAATDTSRGSNTTKFDDRGAGYLLRRLSRTSPQTLEAYKHRGVQRAAGNNKVVRFLHRLVARADFLGGRLRGTRHSLPALFTAGGRQPSLWPLATSHGLSLQSTPFVPNRRPDCRCCSRYC